MSINVKPGDVAIVKAPFVEAGRGAIVEVVRAAKSEERLSGTLYLSCFGKGWVVRGWVAGSGPELVIGDECLRPIRWSEGEDEVLRIAGKPVSRDVRETQRLKASLLNGPEVAL